MVTSLVQAVPWSPRIGYPSTSAGPCLSIGSGVRQRGLKIETDVLSKLKDGDEAAWEHVVRSHAPYVLALCTRILGRHHDAEDCTQAVFARVFKSLETFESRSTLRTWIHRITVNCALSQLRQIKSKSEDSLDYLMPMFDVGGCRIEPTWHVEESIEDLLQRKSVSRTVWNAIDALPATVREILILRDFEGHSTREAAEIIGIGESLVKVRLHRARAALKKLLEPLFEKDVFEQGIRGHE